ncbi:MAG: RNA polymerase sigma-54 factor [Rubrivivax sp.]|nr:MAG: RNA polymerase sigma-54 factor [Rubrivivax sp.]
MPSIDIHAHQRQNQSLSPRLQQAVRMLQMSSLDFSAMVRATLSENPFLEAGDAELAEEESLPGEAEPAPSMLGDLDGDSPLAGSADSVDATTAPDDGADRDLWLEDPGAGGRKADDGEPSAMEMMAVDTPLNTHLHGQINLLTLPEMDLALARVIIESLDDDGYLRTSLAELQDVPGLTPRPSLEQMETALRRVQALDPAGVGARNVSECLLLQMPSIDCPELRALASVIVQHHLDALAAHDVNQLARQLGQSATRIEAACERIRRLDPRPGWRIGAVPVNYVVPDVLVKKVRGRWVVQLNPAVVPNVRMNEVYATLFKRHRTAQHAELGEHLQQARWTLRNVEQRFSTIMGVAEAIVKRQKNFLDYGPMAMKPLGLKEIADEVGIHESTVSRVTNNKYIATPSGVFELKYFFSRAIMSSSGNACSGTAIRELVKDLLVTEDAARPRSDAEIARLLAQQGLTLARRTVTKYRQMLKIDPAERRRRPHV